MSWTPEPLPHLYTPEQIAQAKEFPQCGASMRLTKVWRAIKPVYDEDRWELEESEAILLDDGRFLVAWDEPGGTWWREVTESEGFNFNLSRDAAVAEVRGYYEAQKAKLQEVIDAL